MKPELSKASRLLGMQSKRMMAVATRILDEADAEKRELSEDETDELDQLLTDTEAAVDLGDEAELRSHQALQMGGRKSKPSPLGDSFALTGLPIRPPRNATLEARTKWAAQYFGLKLESAHVAGERAGFSTFGSFLAAVAHSPHDPRLEQIMAAAGESIGQEGGFLVPRVLTAQILGGVFVESSIVGLVSVVPMTSKTLEIAGFNRNNSQVEGAIGGISFSYTGEADDISEKTPAIVNLTLSAHKAAAWVPISNELLSDSPYVSRQLADAFTEAARARLELDVIAGNGAGKPMGILTCPSTIEQAAEGGQAVDTINYANIIKMASRMHPSYWGEAVWLASVATIPQLLNLRVVITNIAGTENVGGSHYMVETDQAGNFRILGRPVLFSAACKPLGDVGDLILVAPSQYALGVRGALTIEHSIHERFRKDQVTFRATMRQDGQGTWATALTLPGTASTVSWAITLAAR